MPPLSRPLAPFCLALHPQTGCVVRCITRADALAYRAEGWKLLACGAAQTAVR